MAYADYEFYTTKYFGNVVPESDFPRFAEGASGQIDIMTNDRLSDITWMSDKQIEKVKKACCAMAESLYYSESLVKSGMEQIGMTEGHGKIITSVTSGSESVSYSVASANSLESQAVQNMIENCKLQAKVFLSGIKYKDKGYTILFGGIGYE